jgi:hypothetical protein
MAFRVLLVLAAFAVLYGCGRASSPPERQEQDVGVEEPKPKEGKKQATVKCEDFISREAAQEYVDTRATEADSKVIDPDGNGKACDEGAYLFASGAAKAQASASARSASASGLSPSDAAVTNATQCRINLYVQEQNMTRAEAEAMVEALADDLIKSIEHPEDYPPNYDIDDSLDRMEVPRYNCYGPEE